MAAAPVDGNKSAVRALVALNKLDAFWLLFDGVDDDTQKDGLSKLEWQIEESHHVGEVRSLSTLPLGSKRL
jgi:hypothetical protein